MTASVPVWLPLLLLLLFVNTCSGVSCTHSDMLDCTHSDMLNMPQRFWSTLPTWA